MFEGLLKSKFLAKSKSAIKMTKTRVEMLKRKRNAMQKFLRSDIEDLLKNGLDVNAYGRAEGLWNELNFSGCYDFVEQFCSHISNHLTEMDEQRECPDECREAASSLMFAAARFADLPELRDLRNVFMERYGSSIECYANKEFVSKFKSTPPSKDMKLQLMQDIATEAGVEWSVKSLEQKLFKHPTYGQEYNKNGNAGERKAPEMIEAAHKHEDPGKYGSAGEVGYLSSGGRKEESRLPKGRKPFDEGNTNSKFHYNQPEDTVPAKDNDVDKPGMKKEHHEPQDTESASREEEYDMKPFYYEGIRAPRYESKISDGSNVMTKTSNLREGSEQRSTNDHPIREDVWHQGDPVDEAKSKPKSVRSRNQKPQADQEKMHGSKPENAEKQSWRWWKASKDREDDMGKSVSLQQPSHGQPDSDRGFDEKNNHKNGPRTRTPSLPVELSQVDNSKGHARAHSLQPEMLNSNGHVHPKLPDYDDFVARLAALRGDMK